MSLNQKEKKDIFLLEQLPQKLCEGKITEKQAINFICTFIMKNYRLFSLYKYDEDFRQEVLVSVIERGQTIFKLYNPAMKNFFSFLYGFVSSVITAKIKIYAQNQIRQRVSIDECISQVEDCEYRYSTLTCSQLEEPKVPYAANKVPAEELRSALTRLSQISDKRILVVALKSSFYLTDDQIIKLSNFYKLNPDHLYAMVQYCKDSILTRTLRRKKVEERRNYAYYHHKKCRTIIENLRYDNDYAKRILLAKLIYKEQKHRKNWIRLNNSFEHGILNLRPTNKTVAQLLGICERQVSYYLTLARKEALSRMNQNLLSDCPV